MKRSSQYSDDVAREIHKKVKKVAVKMKDLTFFGKDPMLIISVVKESKLELDAEGIHDGTGMWLLKQYLTRLV